MPKGQNFSSVTFHLSSPCCSHSSLPKNSIGIFSSQFREERLEKFLHQRLTLQNSQIFKAPEFLIYKIFWLNQKEAVDIHNTIGHALYSCSISIALKLTKAHYILPGTPSRNQSGSFPRTFPYTRSWELVSLPSYVKTVSNRHPLRRKITNPSSSFARQL